MSPGRGLVMASAGSGASVCLVLGVVGVTASGVVSRCGVLADVTVGDGVCPAWVAGVAGSPSSGSCGVTRGVCPVTRVAKSS